MSYTDKRGTQWRLALIPLGGYVKFYRGMKKDCMEHLLNHFRLLTVHLVVRMLGKSSDCFCWSLVQRSFTVVILTFFFLYIWSCSH